MKMANEFKLFPIKVSSVGINPKEIPWGVNAIGAPKLWDKTKGEGIIVAVLDTGIDSKHPDLMNRVVGGRNFTRDYNGDPDNFNDNQSHGTHVAGTIAATVNNMGVIGVAPKVGILVGKVLGGDGSGDYDSIINGIYWAVQWRGKNGERVRIINMSLGGPAHIRELHQAIKYAIANGVSVVCASGNEGDSNTFTNEYSYPGAYEEVIEVGATDSYENLAVFSNTNSTIDVVAPGVRITSTIPSSMGSYSVQSGTSMATPHVSGALALLISYYERRNKKKLTEMEAYNLLIEYTRDLTHIRESGDGKGLVDLSLKELV
jgi:major intracellular serine protease